MSTLLELDRRARVRLIRRAHVQTWPILIKASFVVIIRITQILFTFFRIAAVCVVTEQVQYAADAGAGGRWPHVEHIGQFRRRLTYTLLVKYARLGIGVRLRLILRLAVEWCKVLHSIWRSWRIIARLNLSAQGKVEWRLCFSLYFIIQFRRKWRLLRHFEDCRNVDHGRYYCTISLIFWRCRKLRWFVQLNFRQCRIISRIEGQWRLHDAIVFLMFIWCYRRLVSRWWLLIRPLFRIIHGTVLHKLAEVLRLFIMAHYLGNFIGEELARITRSLFCSRVIHFRILI